jgi:uncharacterized coiled-coil protein SlyX
VEPQEFDAIMQILARQEAQLERLASLQETANERLDRLTQQLDRQDRTMAGISMTLVHLNATLERLSTTLDRWLERHGDGHSP